MACIKKKLLLTALLGASVSVITLSCHHGNGGVQAGLEENGKISYNFQIRPILSDKCFNCHGPDKNKRQAGLRLDIGSEAYKALQDHPNAHALVPGDPSASELFLRVSTKDTAIQMPPASSHLPGLTDEEIALVKKWIAQGAVYEPHWAFVAPRKSDVPVVKDAKWPHNEIDNFVLQQMEKRGLTPNPEADKARLLKRICLDITGLLPSAERMKRFVNDSRPDAYERMVDELLQDSAYGERMALPWLDVARYADSHGYQDDNYRSAWPWRDWVIHAFNENMPYDQFVTWQLAGDQLPDSNREALLATAFNRNHKITEEGGVIDEEYRVQYVTDRTNTLGKAFLGVTIECAHCHDHKYDPFSQKEYYSLFAFFNNVKEVGIESTVGGPDTYAKKPKMEITKTDLENTLRFIQKKDTNKLEISVMGDRDTLQNTYVLVRGNYDAHGDSVQPGTPASILPFPASYPRNRLGLAKWMFNPANPLTARVFVNRVWQEIFGRGIVKSSGDFGMQGDLPSHPALLDWLAVDFREHGWDIKRLMKQILLSSTYRQSAVASPEKIAADPENIYLSRAPRFRMPAETIRDIVLCSSGLLNHSIGGPSVKPYQPPGLWELASSGRGILKTYIQDHGDQLYRRGMYVFIKRTVTPPIQMIFDASTRDQCEVKRARTNTPLQALVMMNDTTVLEASRVLAGHLLQDQPSVEVSIAEGFRRIICREPEKKEMDILMDYYKDRQAYMQANPTAARKLLQVGEYPQDASHPAGSIAALMQVLEVIYNMDEAITKS
ncbi:MAG: PSD1 and planctomycete cytochrome C domain-containing protein [Puia sp.]|nr:PSD1 and planctomycete cytochrome C domain-containing protein [Puia sp.]